jgi:hypothetical protein
LITELGNYEYFGGCKATTQPPTVRVSENAAMRIDEKILVTRLLPLPLANALELSLVYMNEI